MYGIKVRIYPNKKQEEILHQSISCYRYIYNWGLATCMKSYVETGKTLLPVDLGKILTQFKKQQENI